MADNFDYGTDEEIVEPGGDFKNPSVGDHSARLRSLIHVGRYKVVYKGKAKADFPHVIAIFELKEDDDFEEDGVTPLTMHYDFPLKKGDKANCTKFRAALDPKGEAAGFNELIGAACTIKCVPGKEKNEDGEPKYVNFGGMSGLPAKFAKMLEPLTVEGVGHVRFEDITEEAIMELNPILGVNKILMKSLNYQGSKAEAIIAKIRKENPDFAKPKAKDEDEGEETKEEKEPVQEKETNLNEDEEF